MSEYRVTFPDGTSVTVQAASKGTAYTVAMEQTGKFIAGARVVKLPR